MISNGSETDFGMAWISSHSLRLSSNPDESELFQPRIYSN